MTQSTQIKNLLTGGNKLFLVVLFFFGCGFTHLLAAQKPQSAAIIKVDTKVDKKEISIGDKIKYSVIVRTDGDTEVIISEITEKLSGLTVRDSGSDEGGFFGRKKYTRWYVIDTYTSGDYVIPGMEIEYRKKGEKEWQKVKAPDTKIRIQSVLSAAKSSKDIRDIKGPFNPESAVLIYVLLALLTGTIVLLAVIVVKKRRKKKSVISERKRPSHVIAYEALDALCKKNYIALGKFNEYYIELSDIVRRYLEARFNLRAPEMTTEEFLANLRDNRTLSGEHKNLLKDFLAHCDLVKFAKYRPENEEAGLSLQSARRLVDQTKEEISETV